MAELTIYDMLKTRVVGVDALKDLLREYRPADKELRISAEDKDTVVDRNIRVAVDRGIIPIRRLYDLLRAGEENGAQRIFLYLPRNQRLISKYRDGDVVAARLFGDGLVAQGFPKLLDGPSDEPNFADFRCDTSTWTAKFYWKETRHQVLGTDLPDGVDEDGTQIFKSRYKTMVERAILLMRWNGRQMLEVRVPLCSSRRAVDAMQSRVWQETSDTVAEQDFVPYSLVSACTRMIREEDDHTNTYDLNDTLLRDSDGGTHLISIPPADGEDENGQGRLFAVRDRRESIEAIMRIRDNQSERLVVNFKPTPQNGAIKSTLRVVVGARDPHELAIGARVSPEAVDHVINRLRDFE